MMQGPWTEDRLQELDDLIKMVRLVEGINRTTNFLGVAYDAMDIASTLTRPCLMTGRKSFVQFILEQVDDTPEKI